MLKVDEGENEGSVPRAQELPAQAMLVSVSSESRQDKGWT